MQVRLTALGLLCALLMSAAPAAAACDATPGSERFARSGWGFGERNLRFQADTDIDSTNAETLELAWAFALDGGMSPHSYPLVTEDTVFIGTQAGSFFALERDSGCVRWKREFRSSIRTAVIHAEVAGGARLVFGTGDGWVVAADAITGEELWETEVRDHPHDTWRKFDGVNGETAVGASIDVHGPMVAGDMLFIQSGYGQHGQAGGNALLAFRLPRSAAGAQSTSSE